MEVARLAWEGRERVQAGRQPGPLAEARRTPGQPSGQGHPRPRPQRPPRERSLRPDGRRRLQAVDRRLPGVSERVEFRPILAWWAPPVLRLPFTTGLALAY